MYYFKRNIGDYHKKAGRLSMIEHGAYTLLMDACYDREQFPTLDQAYDWCWARNNEEKAAISLVLEKFFVCEDGVYSQSRIQEEIEKYHLNSSINSRIAKDREARKRTNRAQTVHADSTDEHLTTNHKPITNKEKKSIKPDDVSDATWNEWIKMRKTKKASVGELVLSSYRKEASKINWTLEKVLQECVVRNWQGFKADWIDKQSVQSVKQDWI